MQEGNLPRQLAEQQENRKCALLLQEYEASSADAEQDGFPQFQYCKIASFKSFIYTSVLNTNWWN